MRKHGLKVLTLALMAALGLMAFSASAQAENLKLGDEPETGEAGFFLKAGPTEHPLLLNTLTVEGEQVGAGRLLVPAQKIEIACGAGKTQAGAFVENEYENWKTNVMKKGGHGHATLLFLECKVWEIETNAKKEHLLIKELPACTATLESLAENPSNHHITAPVLILIKRHEKKTYVIAEPLIGGGTKAENKIKAEKAEKLTLPFVSLHFEGTCALPETVNITGCVAAEAPAAHEVEPLLSLNTLGDTIQELIGCALKFGASPAFIEGKVKLKLPNNAGVAWGAM